MPVLPVDYDDQEQEYETAKTKRGTARAYVIMANTTRAIVTNCLHTQVTGTCPSSVVTILTRTRLPGLSRLREVSSAILHA